MATHNPKESRPTCESTLAYMYRGDGHEHEVGKIVHLGGNLLSASPIHEIGSEVIIDLAAIAAEFNYQASLHKGKGEGLFKHYVISLAPGEELKDYQWLELLTAYMQVLGFDNATKWTAVEHKNTDSHHVHILACRVKGDRLGSLVSTYKDYEKGWPVMREFEKKFGLQQLESPEDNFGLNQSKGQIKARRKGTGHQSIDDAVGIRGAFKKLYSEFGKPKTMKDLALGLAKCGVDLKVSTDDSGKIKGINYKLRGGKGGWIPGSKVKSTRFTWRALQKKEGISYDSFRDDPFLRRVDGVVEVHIKLTAIQSYYGFKSSTQEYEQNRRILLARFRTKQQQDIESLMALVNAILLLVCILLGIPIKIEDCDFSVYERGEGFANPEGGENLLNYQVDDLDHLLQEVDLGPIRAADCQINPQLIDMTSEYSEMAPAVVKSHQALNHYHASL